MNSGNVKRSLESRRTLLVCMLLAGVTLAAYWRVWSFEFTNYDDRNMLLSNPLVFGGLTLRGLYWALTTSWFEYWHPMTWLSHMLDFELFGRSPGGHHLVSLGIHVANALLLFAVLRRMTAAFWRSAMVAFLFALHPQHVESVAWVAERKDVLSGFFFMLTLWAYAGYAEGRRKNEECRMQNAERGKEKAGGRAEKTEIRSRQLNPAGYYGLALAFFALGLMSKPMLVTVPFVLLLLDYWPLKRLEGNTQRSELKTLLRLVREKLPFFALTVASCAITYAWALSSDNTISAKEVPWGLRLANMPVSYVQYLGKMIWPVDLAVLYPMPGHLTWWQAGGAAMIMVLVTLFVVLRARSAPYGLVGWLMFLGMLFPTIRLVQSGAQSIADRYTYLPSIGIFIALVWGGCELLRVLRAPRVMGWAVAGAAVMLCLGLTRRQVGYWENDVTLWLHAVTLTKDNGTAHYKLGEAFIREDRFAEAIHEYEEVLRLSPGAADAHNSLGSLLARQGRLKEAIEHFSEALRLVPGYVEARYNLGLAQTNLGRYREGAAQFQEVIRLNPNHPNARQKLDQMLALLDKAKHAAGPSREALKANANDARAHSELGWVLLEAGRLDEAIEQCTEAARLEPKNAEVQYQLGAVLARKGEGEKAARQFELALELDPGLAPAHYALGIVCQQQGRMPEALDHWREAARLAPQWPDPLNNLAWALATASQAEFRDGLEAVTLATRAVELAGTNHVGVLDTLAAAYAEAGRFAEATATARQAQAVAVAQGQAELAEQIRQRLTLYGSSQPYRRGAGAK